MPKKPCGIKIEKGKSVTTAQIYFTKMQGLGNDFVILDSITQPVKVDSTLARKIADRHFGIGCDQVLVVEPPATPECDFNYRIFNADGKEVAQCGNGARCFGRYVYERGLTDKKQLLIGTLSGNIIVDLSDITRIQVDMGVPQFSPKVIPLNIKAVTKGDKQGRYKIQIQGHFRDVSILSMGNPHCIMAVHSVGEAPVNEIGSLLQKHPAFPKGVNVTFMQVLARNHVRCRVFERGVGETMACGTAACAAVVSGIMQKELNSQVKVDMPGGYLTVEWISDNGVWLSGPATNVFEGHFAIDLPPTDD